jgi:trans-aconitate 2-methyltransferase
MAAEWDAATYDRIASPQARWGSSVVERLPLRGDERVLDAGCGSGRVTQQLLERLPNGRVVALDGSQAMLDEARRRLASYGDRVEYIRADLSAPLPVTPPVDAILSTATFHWVLDHDALFRHLAAVVVPGGRLVAQCGGRGNIAAVEAILDDLGESRHAMHYFAGPEETEARLEAAGFRDVRCWLEDAPTTFETRAEFETFLATVVLRVALSRRPPEERDAFVRTVVDRIGKLELDYVRLNIDAVRGGDEEA